MHELYKLKDMLCEELKEYGSKEMSAGSLDIVDKLSHAIKNLDKIIEKYEEEEGYSSNYMYEGGGSYQRGGNRGGSYAYARGRGSNARRDSRGRYSSARDGGYSRNDGKEEMVMQLREMMQDAPNDRTRMRIQELIQEFEMQ